MKRLRSIAACALLLASFEGILRAGEDRVPLTVRFMSPCDDADASYLLAGPSNVWHRFCAIEMEVFVPAAVSNATGTTTIVHVKDRDGFWFQKLLPSVYLPGQWNRATVDFSPLASGWMPSGHHGVWNFRTRVEPAEVGIRFFSRSGSADWQIRAPAGLLAEPDSGAPVIGGVRIASPETRCFEKVEISFRLTDRYVNPFDTNAISVAAFIETPEGESLRVPAFFSQDYYRNGSADEDALELQGRPSWKVRFAPMTEGIHKFSIVATDAFGSGQWKGGRFVALPARSPGYVRVSPTDPAAFEFSNGAYFYPIGHNIRSPSDTRYDKHFPWRQRRIQPNSAYSRFFPKMARNGENTVEVWFAPWSLALEWNAGWTGYRGVGDYNLVHAWEMDQLIADAERLGIYVNLIIHNHGKYSSFCDEEWKYNPFNTANGGYLSSPDEYFSDPRALEAFRSLMQYTIARWGYSTHVLAWGLWSELNLAGSKGDMWKRPEVVQWHKMAVDWVRETDLARHMITTHVSGDYNTLFPPIFGLEGIAFSSMDAYYGGNDSFRIADLMVESGNMSDRYCKPALVTEFGGNWDSAGVRQLEDSLHIAIWSAPCTRIAGTPLFWWWEFIEEQDLYREFLPVSKFMSGEDRRRPAAKTGRAAASHPERQRLKVMCCSDYEWALGWIGDVNAYRNAAWEKPGRDAGGVLKVSGLTNGVFVVEFWDTSSGEIMNKTAVVVEDDVLAVNLPSFDRDIAFKIKAKR